MAEIIGQSGYLPADMQDQITAVLGMLMALPKSGSSLAIRAKASEDPDQSGYQDTPADRDGSWPECTMAFPLGSWALWQA